MSKLVKQTENALRQAVLDAMGRAVSEGALPPEPAPAFTVEIPADRLNGDYASNVAMACAKAFRMPPRKIAEAITARIELEGTFSNRCEVAGPGFINFFLSDRYYAAILADIRACGRDYGRSDFGAGRRVMVEFVSANPTGPMHMGNARGGALGDCLAAVLDRAGFDVCREFYVNDAGNQIEKFALSLEVRYLQHFLGEEAVELPEDSYHGDDIRVRAEEFAAVYGDRFVHAEPSQRRQALVAFALPKNIASMQETLAKYRIHYDNWFYESTVHQDGELQETIELFKQAGLTYEQDGALWYRATQRGAEKDEVLVRANGTPTYFAADVAYHRNKLVKRGFDKAIDIWGADHHGHVARMKGALEAIGIDPSRLDVILMQLVRLVSGGEVVRMSKRTGKAITLTDLLDEIPVDAARFLFNLREPGSQMEFDLDLAVEQSAQNPVYYCQYAHARICSILKKLAGEGIAVRDCTEEELCLLDAPEERALIRHLSALTDEIILAARNYDPARITRYVIELATLFHKFYNACRVRVEEEPLMQARISLCICVRDTIRNVLELLKIDAPEAM